MKSAGASIEGVEQYNRCVGGKLPACEMQSEHQKERADYEPNQRRRGKTLGRVKEMSRSDRGTGRREVGRVDGHERP